MPFTEGFPRTFSAGSVREHAPAAPGVYGLTSAAEWIYIGAAEDIREALLAHLADPKAEREAGRPTGFVYEVCERDRRAARQVRLVEEYKPTRNQGRGRHGGGRRG